MIKIAIKGKRYRVINDSEANFLPGEIVVAIEQDDTPYCVREDIYDENKGVYDYDENTECFTMFYTDDEDSELEEVED